MKLFADEKKRYRNLLLVILPLVLLAGFFVFMSYKSITTIAEPDPVDTRNYLEEYGYMLRDNATDLQKELFEELKEDLAADPQDELKIAEDIAKNYVADFYTWSNKAGKYDIGGMYYIVPARKANIYLGARDYFYRYLNEYIEEYGSDDLIEVESIEVVESGKLPNKMHLSDLDVDLDQYYIDLSWTYKPTKRFDTSKFENQLTLKVVKNGNRFELIEVFGFKEMR